VEGQPAGEGSGGEVGEVVLVGQEGRGAAGGKPEGGPRFPFLRQSGEEDRGDDDGFADV